MPAPQLARACKTLAERLARKKPVPQPGQEITDPEGAPDIFRTEETHWRAGELERLDVLPSRERLFIHVIRMLACRCRSFMPGAGHPIPTHCCRP